MWRKPNEVNPSLQPSARPVSSPKLSEERTMPPASPSPSVPLSSAPAFQPAPAPAPSNASRISAGLKIHGDLSGSSDLYIDGEVQGKIRLDNARVTVGPSGRVQAEIEAREIIVEGEVQGNLKAAEGARFGATSRVVGSVLSPRIGIEDGAKLRGKVETVRPAQSASSTANQGAPEPENVPAVASGVRSE